MKMIRLITAILVVCVGLLAGCSIKAPEHKPAYTAGELTMISACRSWVKEIETNSNAQFQSIPETQKAFVYMHGDTMHMIESVWGKGDTDICQPGTGYAVAYEAYVKGQTEIAVEGLKQAGATTRVIAYVVGVLGVSDSLAGSSNDTSTTVKETAVTETTSSITGM